jgi:hypothetical protein
MPFRDMNLTESFVRCLHFVLKVKDMLDEIA